MMKRIGILGGGQLGRMLALAGLPLGLRFSAIEPADDPPVKALAEHLPYAYDDLAGLELLADNVDMVTYEFENVALATAEYLEKRVPVFPSSKALMISQERFMEKEFFSDLGIPTTEYYPIDSIDDCSNAKIVTGLPAVLKTRRFGYDGKGQVIVHSVEEIRDSFTRFNGVPLILEQKINFTRELSIIAARSRNGETAFYPLMENVHKNGILLTSRAPARHVAHEMASLAKEYAAKLLDGLDYVGVLAIEFFEVNGKLIANEFAPRVHNSGHWTIDGACTSQFENHLRAILDLPLGNTDLRSFSAMVNLIGEIPDLAPVLKIPDTHVHLYDKEPRPSRKLGHVTVCGDSPDAIDKKLEQLMELIIPVY